MLLSNTVHAIEVKCFDFFRCSFVNKIVLYQPYYKIYHHIITSNYLLLIISMYSLLKIDRLIRSMAMVVEGIILITKQKKPKGQETKYIMRKTRKKLNCRKENITQSMSQKPKELQTTRIITKKRKS